MSNDLFNDILHNTSDEIDEKSGEFYEATLSINKVNDDIYNVTLHLPQSLEKAVEDKFFSGNKVIPQTLFRVDYGNKTISIFPLITYYSEHLYQRKYNKIKEIQFPLDLWSPVLSDEEDAIEILQCLPSSLQKDVRYGLGFVREMRPILYAIETLPGVNRIVISQAATEFKAGTYYYHEDEYHALASGINAITRKYQADSLRERKTLAYNEILHQIDPQQYPLIERPYEPGTIFKLLGGTKAGETRLRGKDRQALISAVNANAAAIAKRDHKEFVQLQKDIEVVSLDVLIKSFEQRLRRNANEDEWQKLLEINPFILSMLFGQPIVVLQSGANVGGQTLAGDGTKIADFLAKNSRTHNTAIVELKRPKTKLFGKEYRRSVFSPSSEIAGSIVQVLDQRLKLMNELPLIKHRNRMANLQTYAVECVIVAGRTPTDESKIASFEMIRNQMKDVRIVTFDELLDRLITLRELLSGERYVSDLPEEEDEGGHDEMEDLTPHTDPI